MPKRRVLLTGAAGFIGAHVLEHLMVNTDWDVVAIDGLRHVGDAQRLADSRHFDRSRCTVIWHDLRAKVHAGIQDAIGDIDYVLSLAADSHVDRSISDPVPFVGNNVAIALNVFELCRVLKPSKVIQVGTDEIFGPALDGVSHAEDAPLRPSNPYSASKACQEAIAFAWWRTYGVPVVLTRTMNNFGERQDAEKYVPRIIRAVLEGREVTIHAQPLVPNADPLCREHWRPGSRVWLHARNHADALLFILREITPMLYGEAQAPFAYNIAGERELDNYEIAELVARCLGRPLRYRFVDYHSSRPGHDLRYSLDGSRLRREGWQQPIDMEASFARAVEWERRRLERA